MARSRHIVLCEKRFPFPPDHGRATRIITLAQGLRSLGFHVTLLVCEGSSTTLEDGTRIRAIPPLPWPLRELVLVRELRRIDREELVDYVQVQNDVFVVAAVLARLAGFRILYDAQVVEADYWSALRPRSLRERASSVAMPLCERILCRLSERVSVLSEPDAHRLAEVDGLPPEKVFVIPMAARALNDVVPATVASEPHPVVLFLGSYDHRPNADAIDLIAKEIRPRVLEEIPDAKFRIVGKGLPVDQLRAQGLDPQSNVPEVAPFIDAATVCIAPVRVGSGVRTKLVEYLSRGKPVVAMTAALEGLPLDEGSDVLVADDVEAFVKDVVSLLRDPDLRKRMGRAGLERIRTLTGREAGQRALTAFYGGPQAP